MNKRVQHIENTPYLFNAKELNEETGLYYYGARYYNPRISLWLSVDPLAEQTMTPYQYTYQNPVRFVDPTGMKGDDWYEDEQGNVTWHNRSEEEFTDESGNQWTNVSDADNSRAYTLPSGEGKVIMNDYNAVDYKPENHVYIDEFNMTFEPSDKLEDSGWKQTVKTNWLDPYKPVLPKVVEFADGNQLDINLDNKTSDRSAFNPKNSKYWNYGNDKYVKNNINDPGFSRFTNSDFIWEATVSFIGDGKRITTVNWGSSSEGEKVKFIPPVIQANPQLSQFHKDAIR
ncbi:MAG: RHS repeat-associated core domain-containing protein [Flavobacteriales bacterium]